MTVEIEVQLSPVFETLCSAKCLSFRLQQEEPTVGALLRNLSFTYGEKMRGLLFEKGGDRVVAGLMVMVNDRTFTGNALNQGEVELQEGDRVSLLYFVSGG